tara:strand:- start:2916 stop:3077 length:162 start_codon:yes stop_codon:yes gene_type:complete
MSSPMTERFVGAVMRVIGGGPSSGVESVHDTNSNDIKKIKTTVEIKNLKTVLM